MFVKIGEIIDKYSKLNEEYNSSSTKFCKDEYGLNCLFSFNKKYDLFLSYNHKDITLAKAIYQELQNQGISVYADFIDLSFKPIVDKNTAKILCDKIANCKALAYIHTENAKNSKWCPWEIGLASGLKDFKCVIIPAIVKDDNEFDRQEYLTLYPFTSYTKYINGKGPFFWVKTSMTGNGIRLLNWIHNL